MTTFELHPEPPIGSRVRDKNGNIWTRGTDWWEWDTNRVSWRLLMTELPLTLIEPDPWPTESEPLIAAEGRLWFRQEDGDYLDKDGTVRGEGRHVFTGPVVPVTVVPVDALRRARESYTAASVMLTYRDLGKLLAETDALGVDL